MKLFRWFRCWLKFRGHDWKSVTYKRETWVCGLPGWSRYQVNECQRCKCQH